VSTFHYTAPAELFTAIAIGTLTRSRTSAENFGDFDSVVMAPVSQELEPPANPGRTIARAAEAIRYTIKRFPPKVLSGKFIEINDKPIKPCKFMLYEGEASRADPSKEQDHAFEQWRR
jgi:hypothetical protein